MMPTKSTIYIFHGLSVLSTLRFRLSQLLSLENEEGAGIDVAALLTSSATNYYC
jgi:hypothetical protein